MARKNMYIKSDPEGKRARIGAGGPSSYAAMQPFSRGPGLPGNSPSALSDNPPCNTLFVGNLSDNINEAELTSVFSTSPGFRTVKVLRGRTTTAFVAYETTEQAIQAHGAHQNAVLASNAEKGSIRIQFSKNPFGRKRDYNGEPAGGGDPLAAAAAAGAAAAAAAASKAAYEPAPYNPLASL
mmetsp:Transcript_20582/g.53688  ORF Transcript_20582/g.53688 Transcript_20582/m.53688 type:complete len:182 (-) Transcript_20582:650-1195(-)